MKIVLILLIAATAVLAAPVEDGSASVKEKRGLAFGVGYHAPIVTSHYVAPTLVHHAPVISHAPVIAHAPLLRSTYTSYHLPTYSAYHHL